MNRNGKILGFGSIGILFLLISLIIYVYFFNFFLYCHYLYCNAFRFYASSKINENKFENMVRIVEVYNKPPNNYHNVIANNHKNYYHMENNNINNDNYHDYRYCLIGDAAGRFGNQVLSLLNAQLSAMALGTKVAIFSKGEFVDVLKNTLEFDENIIMWYAYLSDHLCSCQVHETWSDAFMKTFSFRERNLYNLFKMPRPFKKIRDAAENAMKYHNPDFTVHGRHLEGFCFHSPSRPGTAHEHTPVACLGFKYDLCNDFSLSTVRSLFNFSGEKRPLLMSDSQLPDMDKTYPVKDEHDFHVQLWMMAMSPNHVGNPNSSDDFIVWLWKQQYFPHTLMYPLECYPLLLPFTKV